MMNTHCDIEKCNQKSIGIYEDMRDGEYVSLCRRHAWRMRGRIR